MADLRQYGLYSGQGKHHEEIIYTTALIYSVASHRLSEYLRGYNLTSGRFNILVALNHHGGEEGLSQVDLSRHLIVTPSNMTKMVDRLEKEGLVTRSALEGDRRVRIIKTTPAAQKLLSELWDGFQDNMKEIVRGVTQEKQGTLSELLIEWFESIER